MRGIAQFKRSDSDHDPELTGILTGTEVDVNGNRRREDFDVEEGGAILPGPVPRGNQRKGGFLNFLRGPSPPRPQKFLPFFPYSQQAPLRYLETRGWNQKRLLAIVLFAWFTLFAFCLTSELPIKDGSGKYVVNLDCTDTLWKRKNECGIDGLDCRPFSNQSFAFRCPANCADVQLLNPYVVGTREVNYQPLVIGTDMYVLAKFRNKNGLLIIDPIVIEQTASSVLLPCTRVRSTHLVAVVAST